ncbi:hypothetical protein BC940DRAFT_368681 [Gongronella butleri]|nr:hypothetical protein BC940DRAFT_368681 [Gongronella butleri]
MADANNTPPDAYRPIKTEESSSAEDISRIEQTQTKSTRKPPTHAKILDKRPIKFVNWNTKPRAGRPFTPIQFGGNDSSSGITAVRHAPLKEKAARAPLPTFDGQTTKEINAARARYYRGLIRLALNQLRLTQDVHSRFRNVVLFKTMTNINRLKHDYLARQHDFIMRKQGMEDYCHSLDTNLILEKQQYGKAYLKYLNACIAKGIEPDTSLDPDAPDTIVQNPSYASQSSSNAHENKRNA